MTAWTDTELADLDRVAAKHAQRAQELLNLMGSPGFKASGQSYQATAERIRLAELTALALREFSTAKRAARKAKP